jgi:hypothetical protein
LDFGISGGLIQDENIAFRQQGHARKRLLLGSR